MIAGSTSSVPAPDWPAFWDCHAAIGRWTVPPPGGWLDEAALRRELQASGIAGALVHHGLARDYDPAIGNEALLQEIGAASTLLPCVTLLPHHTGEVPPPRAHVPQLLAQGACAVRLYPKSHTFSLAPWCAGDLLETLAEHRVPLSIELAETSWETLHEVCSAHPALPVIVTRVSYRQERYLYALWERHDNLYVDISHFQGHRAIEEAVERFGPERLLFGTGLPFYAPGGPVLLVMRAEIDEPARRAIAGGNLLRLIGAVRARGGGRSGSGAPAASQDEEAR